MFIRIGGKQMYLWRAVDAEGEVLDVLVQAKRDKKAARKLMRKLLKVAYATGITPEEWVTDKCPAYGAALRELKLTRALPRSGATTRAQAARVQVAQVSPAVPLDARDHLQRLHRSSSPRHRSYAPALPR